MRTLLAIHVMLMLILTQIYAADDGVEIVKAISPDMKQLNDPEKEQDQVALESQDQDSPPAILLPHPPPPVGGNRANIGQPFVAPSQHMAYHGPPPPPPPHLAHMRLQHPPAPQYPKKHHPNEIPDEKQLASASAPNELWASPATDTPKIISLDVKCEKKGMKVFLQFDKPFYGIVFSKGHYSNINCVYLPAGLGRTSATFEIGIHACGTSGNFETGLYGYGGDTNSGTFFENIIVIQYDPQVQEVWDQARKLRCTWHDQYEKSVTFRPFPVDMLDIVRADFAGDNVGCWMQIQVGKGPWASEVSGLVKIGQTMTMVLAIKDDDSKFDMLVRNCVAHDGKRAPIQLVDQRGCVTRPKLMSRFTKIKNFGASASVLSYAHFQAFKFPDSMEVHFQCTIQICRFSCPDQCSDGNVGLDVHHLSVGPESQYGPPPPQLPFLNAVARNDRRIRRTRAIDDDPEKEIGLNRIIKVVSSGDLTFPIAAPLNASEEQPTVVISGHEEGLICMTTPGFTISLVVLLSILFSSCMLSAFLYIRLRPYSISVKERGIAFTPTPSPTHAIPTVKRVAGNTLPKKRYAVAYST
ncbi:uncharacterized protein LOC116343957 [Contarinia nasturtii]|uniref:uncharacterized protein LOC116343957 n=1 Tax=Contarinia nasturtii TaxID=265458 RepID=UPI0012D46CD2|nr:uncharacterized protein LOC116343957 [Contarinia nasturtii]